MDPKEPGERVSVSKIFRLLPELRYHFDENEFSVAETRYIKTSELSEEVEMKEVYKHWWSPRRRILSRKIFIISHQGDVLGKVGYVDNRPETESIGNAIVRISNYVSSSRKETLHDLGFMMEFQKEAGGTILALKRLSKNITEVVREVNERYIQELFKNTPP